ncbi:sensor histidine kinase [Natronorubrum sp. FCH18a]|uniref:sensor histidine kinase n=1 Tax=Natronorubrum sp. FCH18a TaxID=3447018 RepID=UPI003F518B02
MGQWVKYELERRHRERKLEQREQRYRTLAESFPNGVVTMFDTDHRCTLAAGQAFDNLPISGDEIEGQTVGEAWGEEAATIVEPAYEDALDGEERVVEVEYADREWRIFVVPIRDEAGTVFAGMTMAQDVTEQKERERFLQDTKAQLEAATEAGAVGTWEWHVPEDRFVAGASLARQFGLDPDEAREGVSLDHLISSIYKEDREHVEAKIEDVLESCGEYETEYRVWNEDDELRWVVARGHVECDEDGNPVRFPGALTDITERKKNQQRLEETIEKLERSNERLEQFAYAASHDLQEPLRMVSSYLQIIERRYEDDLDDDGEEFLEFAINGADRMRDMIEALLEYSRIETRGDPLEPIDLDVVFGDVLDDLAIRIKQSDADITVDSLPQVQGDRRQIRQLFQNLLDNAITYSGDEPPRVHVSAEQDGSEWIVSVRDEGIGIDSEHTDEVFEVFRRLHSRDEYPGSGIGLALCQRIVERHGGKIWVESEPDEGTTFMFTLPELI